MISVNEIGPHGAEKIAEALKVNTTLTSVDVLCEDLISLFCCIVVLCCEYCACVNDIRE